MTFEEVISYFNTSGAQEAEKILFPAISSYKVYDIRKKMCDDLLKAKENTLEAPFESSTYKKQVQNLIETMVNQLFNTILLKSPDKLLDFEKKYIEAITNIIYNVLYIYNFEENHEKSILIILLNIDSVLAKKRSMTNNLIIIDYILNKLNNNKAYDATVDLFSNKKYIYENKINRK